MKSIERKIIGSVLLCGMLGLWSGCERNYKQYDPQLKDAIYIVHEDKVCYVFVEGQTSESIYPVTVKLIGMTRNYEREIAFETLNENTAQLGVHYDFPESTVLPQDTTEVKINLKLYPDEELLNDTVQLFLTLKENEHFRLLNGPDIQTSLRIFITMQPQSAPGWWDNNTWVGQYKGADFLGPYSPELYYQFMHFWGLVKGKNAVLYETIAEDFGEDLNALDYNDFESLIQYGLWDSYRVPLLRYVVRPLYDYYYNEGRFTTEELAEKGIEIPEPEY